MPSYDFSFSNMFWYTYSYRWIVISMLCQVPRGSVWHFSRYKLAGEGGPTTPLLTESSHQDQGRIFIHSDFLFSPLEKFCSFHTLPHGALFNFGVSVSVAVIGGSLFFLPLWQLEKDTVGFYLHIATDLLTNLLWKICSLWFSMNSILSSEWLFCLFLSNDCTTYLFLEEMPLASTLKTMEITSGNSGSSSSPLAFTAMISWHLLIVFIG